MGVWSSVKAFGKQFPVSRKPFITVGVLSAMGCALVFVRQPYGTGLFSLGVLLLASDYTILRMAGIGSLYRWVEANDAVRERVKRNYRAKRYREKGPNRLAFRPQTEGNLRAHIDGEGEYLFEGMPFRVYVEAPSSGTTEDLNYHLQLASAKLTRLSDGSNRGTTAFFTITEWEDEFEDETEREYARTARAEIERGSEDVLPFGKVKVGERVNEFDLEEWRAIYDWAKEEEF